MNKSNRNKKAKISAWFPQAKFGMFIHWGSYSVLGHGEQPLFRQLLNPSEYASLADKFRAERFDAGEWARIAKQAEMKYMVLTAKHHDGFCLFNTATTNYNACKRGPGRDLVAEYVRACRKAGLRVGLYFSLADWSIPAHFAGPKRDQKGFAGFIRLVHSQVRELMSNYGRIDLLWFDGQNYFTAQDWQSTRLVKMIRSYQPDIIINDRLPKPKGGGDWGYETPEQKIGAFSRRPWESCITSTRKFWGYHLCHEDETMWYSLRELIDLFIMIVSRNGNLLLNVGPKTDGVFPRFFTERVRAMGTWIRANKAALCGTHNIINHEFAHDSGRLTAKANRIYLCFLYWPGREFSFPGFKQKLEQARFLATGKPVKTCQEKHRIVFKDMPLNAPDICPVVELVFDSIPKDAEWAKKRLWGINLEGMEKWARL